MIEDTKPVELLAVEDLKSHPVWQFTNREGMDETLVRPVKRIPVASLTNKIVGTEVTLAGGGRVWATLSNVEATSPRMTEHFLLLSVEHRGVWFHLARYHDFDRADRGPDALARFLGLPVDRVFPIAYDIRSYATGVDAALCGEIPKEPRERLSRAEIIAMAVP